MLLCLIFAVPVHHGVELFENLGVYVLVAEVVEDSPYLNLLIAVDILLIHGIEIHKHVNMSFLPAQLIDQFLSRVLVRQILIYATSHTLLYSLIIFFSFSVGGFLFISVLLNHILILLLLLGTLVDLILVSGL